MDLITSGVYESTRSGESSSVFKLDVRDGLMLGTYNFEPPLTPFVDHPFVTSIDDVLEELNPLADRVGQQRTDQHGNDIGPTIRSPAELRLNDVEQRVLQAIEPTGSLVDEVVATSGLPVHRVLSTISVLEVRHLIHRLGGNRMART